MNLFSRIFLLIAGMIIVNVRHFWSIYFYNERESKAYYIIFNVISFATFFYLLFFLA